MRPIASKSFTRILAAVTAFYLAAGLAGPIAGPARAAEVNVEIDQAKLIRLDRPGAEVIIGNPSIADVAVQSGKLLVVTGKSSGLTNLMVLDGAGNLMYDKKVNVSIDVKRLVTINKGVARETYSCTPTCGPALVPGDVVTFFEPLSKSIRNKLGIAQSAADGTAAQQ